MENGMGMKNEKIGEANVPESRSANDAVQRKRKIMGLEEEKAKLEAELRKTHEDYYTHLKSMNKSMEEQIKKLEDDGKLKDARIEELEAKVKNLDEATRNLAIVVASVKNLARNGFGHLIP